MEKFAEDFHQIVYREKVVCKEIGFTMRADKNKYMFSYTINGNTINAAECSVRFLCTGIPNRCFTGTVVGVFAEGDKRESASIRKFVVR